jgi:hypothetical protein
LFCSTLTNRWLRRRSPPPLCRPHNAGHVPDLIEGISLTELKVYTCHLSASNRQLGQGTQRYGGSPSTNDGHYIAFGNTRNTEEALIASTGGNLIRRSASTGCWRRGGGRGVNP